LVHDRTRACGRVNQPKPFNGRGEPIRTSREWKTMNANAIAKAPEDRSPAEQTAVRRELSEG
jgi:hypothetical protein